jgi:[citrate (pro-3S)-lyase] ligase
MISIGTPFQGEERERLRSFLSSEGLRYDEGIQYSVNLLDEDGGIAATGSLEDNVVKCMLVAPNRREEGLAEKIVTQLLRESKRRGDGHLFVFTKPENEELFRSMGLYRIASSDEAVLLENRADGIRRFVASLERPKTEEPAGAVICNCNPFTNGHLWLLEKAAAACAYLHVFVVSADKSVFPAADRLQLVREGTAGLPNVLVHPTGPYLISAATFSDYFLKDRCMAEKVRCDLDLNIFYNHFALPLRIGCRFVGDEPYCRVTAAYNRQMKDYLGARGISVVEFHRMEQGGEAVSASKVRRLLSEGRISEALRLVPPCTQEYLNSEKGRKSIGRLREGTG